MVARVLIIGGYGNFGGYIARSLAGDAEIRLLVGGRSVAKGQAFIASIQPVHPAETHAIDIDGDLPRSLARIAPDIVVHTSGPFQTQDHRVARACIAQGGPSLPGFREEIQIFRAVDPRPGTLPENDRRYQLVLSRLEPGEQPISAFGLLGRALDNAAHQKELRIVASMQFAIDGLHTFAPSRERFPARSPT